MNPLDEIILERSNGHNFCTFHGEIACCDVVYLRAWFIEVMHNDGNLNLSEST